MLCSFLKDFIFQEPKIRVKPLGADKRFED